MVHLEGGCLVNHCNELELQRQGNLSWRRVAGPTEGTKKLSLFYFELEQGESGNISFANSEVVLYMIAGTAQMNIAGCEFEANADSGVHIRAGEAFKLRNIGDTTVCCTATVCPGVDEFLFLAELGGGFNEQFPDRLINANQSVRQATGDRFYRLLVGPQTGSEHVTQFIGMIPESRAPKHFHLYEEAIYILSGSGYMWAGETNTPVTEGSMIFLPAKQRHCLECTDPKGMLLVGSFYPAGSPAVNYSTAE